jgi:hypothetical protein
LTKKLAFLLFLVFLVVGTASADTPSINQGTQTGLWTGTVPVLGWPGPTKTVTVDNTARTIQSIYENGGGSWLRGGLASTDTIAPSGMIFTCKSSETRFAFGGSTPTASTMHSFPADASFILMGPGLMSTGKWIAASGNTSCGMTPLY